MYFFIYETKNKINGKLYRGCHATEDLYDGYLGSGVWFKEAVRKYGKENFEVNILCFCDDIQDMIEKEKVYVDEEWVAREDTYNLQTGGLNYGILSEDSKERISKSVKEAHKNGAYSNLPPRCPLTDEHRNKISVSLKKRYEEHQHHSKGKPSGRKGVKMTVPVWNRGVVTGPMPEEQKTKISDTLKKRYEEHQHHSKGKPSKRKGVKTDAPAWNKGKVMDAVVCPHCGKKGSVSNMKRWHFDNCKLM